MKHKTFLWINLGLLLLASCASGDSSLSSGESSSNALTSLSSDSSTSSQSSTSSSSSSSVTESSSASSSSEIIDQPEVLALIDEYDVDNPDDLQYELIARAFDFDMVMGYGIQSEDYVVTGNIIAIKMSFLKHFTTVGEHQLTAHFTNLDESNDVPFTFEIIKEQAAHRIINEGFETGDYQGWNGYQVWKDEAGLFSFRQERIVATDFYGSTGSHVYNRDGNYHLGIYAHPYDNENKDLNQERMGMLRSSDFILGGSGWISFKLGGGKNTGTAYISIKESATNKEIARFGNRHFGHTTQSGTVNAEGYLFQYYANLSSHIGKTLYVLVTDAASHEWSVLSLDSVITYYPSVPQTTPEQLAVDIKPDIQGSGSHQNQITANLTTSVTGWEDPNDIFQFSDGRARSNRNGGDSALGVMRSPAFTIDPDGNYLLVWEWEGALMYDKQLFLSVKEAETNIEVKRLTRRDDLATKVSGGLDKHWADLSDLNSNHEYYVELVDNITSGWGLISLKTIELTTGNDSRVQVAGDRASEALYPLARVDFETGGHRRHGSFAYEPNVSVFNDIVSLGEQADTSVIVAYQSSHPGVMLEVKASAEEQIVPDTITREINDDFTRAEFRNLNAAQTYQYRFCEFDRATIWRTFKMPDPNQFSFVFAADSQANSVLEAQVLNRMLTAASSYSEEPSFVLSTGDVVEIGANNKMWEWFFEMTTLRHQYPFMATTGNHDYYNPDYEWNNNDTFEKYVPHPQNGEGTYSSYYFKIGTTLFIMLDAVNSVYGHDQIAWFENVIASEDEGLVIVGTHYSAYGSHHTDTAAAFEAVWAPVFDARDVDLVLSGHDHLFLRTPPLTGGLVDRDNGVIYLTGGSASAKIYEVPSEEIPFYDFALTTVENVVTIFTIENNYLEATTINQDGAVIDSFTIGSN